MALNPNTIKALFGKLAPLADDAAGAVAKYGDDVANDLTRLSKYVSKHNALSPQVPLPVKTALQAAPVDSFGLPIAESTGVLTKLHDALDDVPVTPYSKYEASRTFNNAVLNAGMRGNIASAPITTTALGPMQLHEGMALGGPGSVWHEPDIGSISIPELPKSQLVDFGTQLRPHKNTALGRWFDSVKNDPKHRRMYEYAIGPSQHTLDTPWESIAGYDTLPFPF